MLDIIIVNQIVHGGNLHKLCHLHNLFKLNNLNSWLIFSSQPPLGIQIGEDVDLTRKNFLEKNNIYIKNSDEIYKLLSDIPCRLVIFDAYEKEEILELRNLVKNKHAAMTAQINFLFDDFVYYDTDYLFLQHPLTLYIVREIRKRPEFTRLAKAKKIFFAGNIGFEPLCNIWTTDIRTKQEFFKRYNLDEKLPLCVWLPDRYDGRNKAYGEIIEIIKSTPMNILTKLHPWEYKNKKYVFAPIYGQGKTSADFWGVSAIEEKDSSWAYEFCDFAIARNSAIGLEITWWKKPIIYIEHPDDYAKGLVKAYACAKFLKIQELKTYLQKNFPFGFEEKEYLETKRKAFPDGAQDSFQLHLKYILDLLNNPHRYQQAMSIKDIVSSYKSYPKPRLSLKQYSFFEVIKEKLAVCLK